MPLTTGTILNNRYRIVRLLGQGGFGAIYRVWDLNMECPRALKENLGTSPEAQRQFKREAQLLDKLIHPHLPRVIDHFIIPGQGQYLVMDFVEGEDLQQRLERAGVPLVESEVLPWIEQVCDALNYLHRQNPPVVHRDIKPANIRITPEGKALLVDFGIAKLYDPHTPTTLGARAATPGFSPLEQYGRGVHTDARSDVYALGATLYALLTAQVPPEAPERALGKMLPPPRQLNPAISPRAEQAILKALEMQPEQRFPTVEAFKAALQAKETQPVQPLGKMGTVIVPFPSPTPPMSGQAIAAPGEQRKWGMWAAIGAGALLGLLLIGWALLNIIIPPPPTPTQDWETQTELAWMNETMAAQRTQNAEHTEAAAILPSPTTTETTSWKQGKLAYVLKSNVGTSLNVLDLTLDSQPVPIFEDRGRISAPAWSPDGVYITFHLLGGDLFMIKATPGSNLEWRNSSCTGASWSPDGKRLICSSSNNYYSILDSSSGIKINQVSTSYRLYTLSWSPSVDEFAYAVKDGDITRIERMQLGGNVPTILADTASENYAPSYSPDGQWIAYQSNKGSSLSEIWVMTREGNNPRRVTFTSSGAWSRAPSWSPDGKWLAYVSNQVDSAGPDFGEIFLVSLETGDVYQLTFTNGNVYDWRVTWGK